MAGPLRPFGPVRRTFPRGLIAGAAGLIAGSVCGWIWWRLAGLASMGAAALVVTALVVDRLTAKRRRLTASEIDYARVIYEDGVDYARISLTRDSLFAIGAPRTIMNTVHLKSGWGHFAGDSMDTSEYGLETFIHELGHAWQYQNGGLAYIPKSLWAQLMAWVTKHTRDAAYDWRAASAAAIPWERWNPEQQAEAMADFNRALRRSQGPGDGVADQQTMSLLRPFVDSARRREGAPRF
jgi:hypothetical protein